MHDLVVQIMALLVAITVHEMAHGWAAHRLGDLTPHVHGRLSMSPLAHIDPFGTVIVPLLLILTRAPFLIGWAKPVPVNMRNFRRPVRDMALVSLAGPASNVATAVLAAAVLEAGFPWARSADGLLSGILAPLHSFLVYSLVINAVLAVFNLIPIPPLDGSHVLASLLPRSAARAYARLEPYGMLIIILLLVLGVLDLVLVPVYRLIMGLLLP